MHFEQLWEQAENKFKNDQSSVEEVLNNLILKINLYQSFYNKIKAAPAQEAAKMKSHLMGEILLALTQLSYRENINVYQALHFGLQFAELDASSLVNITQQNLNPDP